MTDYTAGMHRAAQIARELAAMARKCGQRGDGPDAGEAIARAILAEADEEVTPSAEVCTCCGQAVRQRGVVIPSPGADR